MAKSCVDYAPARMDKRVTIQSASQISDGQGGFTETWSDGASVWAWIQPVKGYEKFQASQTQTPLSHKIVTRYRTDITTASRLKYGDRIFWVKEVINRDEANQFLDIRALERATPN
jgi:SPP1 family predicted phage head-tail adaptor